MGALSDFVFADSRSLLYNLKRFPSSLLYYGVYRRLYPRRPNWTPGAVRRMDRFLDGTGRVFEWGSGRSTVWLAGRAGELVSVEHSEKWYRIGSDRLGEKGIDNVEMLLVPPGGDDGFDWEADWPHYGLLGRVPDRPEYLDYVRAVDRFPPESFDCVIVDGRARVACMLQGAPRLRPGGLLVLDDAQRPRYAPCFDIFSDWETESYRFGLRRTSFFRKPQEG